MSQEDVQKIITYYERKKQQLYEDLELVTHSVTKSAILHEISKIEKALADKEAHRSSF